jgi:glycosyltransferase involved in cell wall biosynthesis
MSCGLVWRWSPAKVCIWSQRNVHDMRGHRLERFAYRRASGVICNAKHEIEYLRRTLGKALAPILVVHNGVELAFPVKTRAGWRRELGLDDDAIVATMVANFRAVKDHVTLLHAWREVLGNIPTGQIRPRLLLAGAPQESFGTVSQLAKDLQLLDTVTFLGQVKDISGLLAASDVGVLATKHEGLPNVIIEYMASGLPVVATDLAGNREALGEDAQQALTRLCDSQSLASQLLVLLRDSELRRRLGRRNRQRASQEFSITTMCERTASTIEELLRGHSCRGVAT